MEKITKENYLQKIAEIAKQKTAWTKEVPEPKKEVKPPKEKINDR